MFQLTRRATLGAVLLAAAGMAAPATAQDLRLTAPAAPGGGWDQTARAMQAALQQEGIAKNVQVVNVPGAGGTIGLAQFVNQAKGDPNQLILGGYVMVGAIIANKSPVTLKDVTPIARLIGEVVAVVVPNASPIKSMQDLVQQMKSDPAKVSWAGGSAGGVDHVAVGLVAKAAGVDPSKVNYIPFSGGGEALASIIGGKVTAGASGFSEVSEQIKAGKLRLVAVSGPSRVPGFDAPTFKEAGVDVEVVNWRMVAAPPAITTEQKTQLVAMMDKMVKSKAWQDTLKAKGWEDTYLSGDAFQAALDKEIAQTESILKDIGLAK